MDDNRACMTCARPLPDVDARALCDAEGMVVGCSHLGCAAKFHLRCLCAVEGDQHAVHCDGCGCKLPPRLLEEYLEIQQSLESIRENKEANKKDNLVELYLALTSSLYDIAQWQDGIDGCLKALDLCEELQDEDGTVAAMQSLGCLYHMDGQLEASLECLTKASDKLLSLSASDVAISEWLSNRLLYFRVMTSCGLLRAIDMQMMRCKVDDHDFGTVALLQGYIRTWNQMC